MSRFDKPKPRTGGHVIPVASPATMDAIMAAVARVDDVAIAMELKWGVGRLPALVSQEWSEKFFEMRRLFSAANQSGELADIRKTAEGMIRAWRKLDALATEAGELIPVLGFMEAPMPDGSVLVIADGDISAWAAARADRKAVVYTIEEVARLLASEALLPVSSVKKAFPGSVVKEARVKMPPFVESEIPDW